LPNFKIDLGIGGALTPFDQESGSAGASGAHITEQQNKGKLHIMSDLNTVSLTGRLVRDPVVRCGESGHPWGVFTIASNFHYKNKAGDFQEDAAFVPCKAFGRAAETLAKHKKGDMVIVTGRLRTESWEKEGKTQSQLTLICDLLRFVLSQNGTLTSGSATENGSEAREEANSQSGKPPF
jgi:single-strand DNA-binding protein